MILPAPHGDKLDALLKNDKLPTSDRRRTEELVKRYRTWLASLTRLPTGNGGLTEAVRLLNEYRLFLDLKVVFDSQDDFLYRQKGQLKLDNTVIEEFLPHLVGCNNRFGSNSLALCSSMRPHLFSIIAASVDAAILPI